MKTLRCIGAELDKFVRNLWFPMCVLAVAALSFFTVVNRGEAFPQEELTIWDIVTKYSKEEVVAFGPGMSSYQVIVNGAGEALTMLVPVLAAAPFAIPMALERRTGNLRFSLIRCGRRRYCAASLTAAVLTGGFVMLLGRAVFAALAGLLLPGPWDFGEAVGPEYVLTVIRQLLGYALYGGGSTLAAWLLSWVTTNYYLSLCVPFLLDYILGKAIDWAGGVLWTMGYHENPLIALLPDYMQTVPWLAPMGLACLAVYAALGLLALTCGMAILERRTDRGT